MTFLNLGLIFDILELLDKHEYMNIISLVLTNYINYKVYKKINKVKRLTQRKIKKVLKIVLGVGLMLGLVYGYFTLDFVAELLK